MVKDPRAASRLCGILLKIVFAPDLALIQRGCPAKGRFCEDRDYIELNPKTGKTPGRVFSPDLGII